MTFRQRIRVRYGECDMQRVVFNANYFVYCDDVVDLWTRIALAPELAEAGDATNLHSIGFDFMLKSTQLVWHSPARYGDVLDVTARVARWGNTSFDAALAGSVGDRAVFDATITYVSIDPESQRPTPVPALVRVALERDCEA